jgi:hypothetical protein
MLPCREKLVLFRPPLDQSHPLPQARFASADRVLVDPLNFFKPYAQGGIDVHVVPGNHDSMVLEPNVRVLASRLRTILSEAQPGKPPTAP